MGGDGAGIQGHQQDERSKGPRKHNTVCKHFIDGACRYGSRCKMSHETLRVEWGDAEAAAADVLAVIQSEEKAFRMEFPNKDYYETSRFWLSPDTRFALYFAEWVEVVESERYHRDASKHYVYELSPSRGVKHKEYLSLNVTAHCGPKDEGFNGQWGMAWDPYKPATINYYTGKSSEWEDAKGDVHYKKDTQQCADDFV